MTSKLPPRLIAAILGISTTILLGACGSLPAPSPTPTNTALPLTSTIHYRYSGGIAGFSKEMTITPDGIATLTDRGKLVGTLRLTSARMTELITHFADADFYNLENRYEDKDHPVADDIYVTLGIQQGSRGKEVTFSTARGQDLAPKALLDLASEVTGIASEIEGSAATPTSSP